MRTRRDSWLVIAATVLAVTVAAAWMERWHPADVYGSSEGTTCAVAGLTPSCGSVAK